MQSTSKTRISGLNIETLSLCNETLSNILVTVFLTGPVYYKFMDNINTRRPEIEVIADALIDANLIEVEGLNGSTRIEHAQTYLENIKLTKINIENSASNSTFNILKEVLNQLIAQNPTISSFVLEVMNWLCALANNKAECSDVYEVFEGIFG